MSTVALARAVGVSPRQVIDYEQGRHTPSPARLKRLADVLGISTQVLAGVPRGEETLAGLRRFAGWDRVEAVRLLAMRVPGVTARRLQTAESGRQVRAWREPVVLERVTEALAELYNVSADTVRLAWSRTTLVQADPTAPRSTHAQGAQASAERMWNDLNGRQRAYLMACYRQDQEAESDARPRHAGSQVVGPTRRRKLLFTIKADPAITGYSPIQKRLRAAGQLDARAGATVHALARRGLIRVSEDQAGLIPLGRVPRVLVELTRAGSACARAGLAEPSLPRPPGGLLSRWLWRNLVRVAAAGPEGLPEAAMWGRSVFYLGAGFRPHGTMSRGFIDRIPSREGAGEESYVKEYRWHLTQTGRQHIYNYFHTYMDLYPDITINEMHGPELS